MPKNLIEAVGRKELVKALGTNDPAEANRRVWAVVDAWPRSFDALRNRGTMTEEDKDELIWSHYQGTLERDEQRRSIVTTDAEIEEAEDAAVAFIQKHKIQTSDHLGFLDAALELQVLKDRQSGSQNVEAPSRKIKLGALRKHLVRGESALVDHEINTYLETHGLVIGQTDRADLVRKLIRVEIEALIRAVERDEGNYGGEPADQLIKRALTLQGSSGAPGEKISDVFEIFARENVGGVSADRINQMRRDISLLVQVAGPTCPVSKIDKKMVREWKALLVKFPVKATEMRAFKGMTLPEIVAANETEKKPVLSDRSVNRYLSSLSAFCKWSVNNGYLDQNPVLGMSLAKEKGSTTLPFSTVQLNALFRSPLFTGCQSADPALTTRSSAALRGLFNK